MRFLCLYKPSKPEGTPPTQEEMATMGKLVEEGLKSGKLLATEGCLPSSKGARVRLTDGKFKVTDGPFTEAKEVVGGMAVIQADSKEEAIEQVKAFLASNAYANYQVLGGPQVTVRFIVDNATTAVGENIFLTGSNYELTNWSATAPLGPMFNQIVAVYPSWYTDVSVPASTAIQFKFIRKGPNGTVWEGGSNHTFTTPASGTATVNVTWQP